MSRTDIIGIRKQYGMVYNYVFFLFNAFLCFSILIIIVTFWLYNFYHVVYNIFGFSESGLISIRSGILLKVDIRFLSLVNKLYLAFRYVPKCTETLIGHNVLLCKYSNKNVLLVSRSILDSCFFFLKIICIWKAIVMY